MANKRQVSNNITPKMVQAKRNRHLKMNNWMTRTLEKSITQDSSEMQIKQSQVNTRKKN